MPWWRRLHAISRAARPPAWPRGCTWWWRCPPERDEAALLEAARAAGVGLSGLSEHAVEPAPPALLLGYGRIAEPAIEAGVRALRVSLPT